MRFAKTTHFLTNILGFKEKGSGMSSKLLLWLMLCLSACHLSDHALMNASFHRISRGLEKAGRKTPASDSLSPVKSKAVKIQNLLVPDFHLEGVVSGAFSSTPRFAPLHVVAQSLTEKSFQTMLKSMKDLSKGLAYLLQGSSQACCS